MGFGINFKHCTFEFRYERLRRERCAQLAKHTRELNYMEKYNLDYLQNLINNRVEESLHLDYKASGALAKQNEKTAEISKDVSAMANSTGAGMMGFPCVPVLPILYLSATTPILHTTNKKGARLHIIHILR